MERTPYSDIKPNIINLMTTSEGSYGVSSAGQHQSYHAKLIPAILAPVNVVRFNSSEQSQLLSLPTLSDQSPFHTESTEHMARLQNLNHLLETRRQNPPSPNQSNLNYNPCEPSISEMCSEGEGEPSISEMCSEGEGELRMPLSNGTKVRISGILKSLKTFLRSKNEHRDIPKIPCNKLAAFLREFFTTLKKSDGQRYESKSLCVMFTCLRRHILDTYGFDMNSVEQFRNIKDELKAKSWGYSPNPSLAFTSPAPHPYSITLDDVATLYKNRVLGFHNPRALNNTLFHICCLLGFNKKAMIYNLTLGDFKVVYDSECSFLECVTPPHNPLNHPQHNLRIRRLAALPSNLSHCPVKTFEVLLAHRPFCFKSTESQLFLAPTTVNPREVYLDSNCWYKTFRMGVNGIGNIVRRLAEDGGLKHAQHMNNQSMKRNVFLETTFDVIKFDMVESFRGKDKEEFVKITKRLMAGVDCEQTGVQAAKSQKVHPSQGPHGVPRQGKNEPPQNKNTPSTAGERDDVTREYQQLIEKLWPTLQNQHTILGIKDLLYGQHQQHQQTSEQAKEVTVTPRPPPPAQTPRPPPPAKTPPPPAQTTVPTHQTTVPTHQTTVPTHQTTVPTHQTTVEYITRKDLDTACDDIKSKLLEYLKWSDAKFLNLEEQRLKAVMERENRQMKTDRDNHNMLDKIYELLSFQQQALRAQQQQPIRVPLAPPSNLLP